MNKVFLIGLVGALVSMTAMAQEDNLFPELQGQFKAAEIPAEKPVKEEPKAEMFPELQGQFKVIEPEKMPEKAEVKAEAKDEAKKEAETKTTAKPTRKRSSAYLRWKQKKEAEAAAKAEAEKKTKPDVKTVEEPAKIASAPDVGPQKEGNLLIGLMDIQGTLPYARSLSYCSANVVLENHTNRDLEMLNLVLTYDDMKTKLNYSKVAKGGTTSQNMTLIGPPCESILTTPEIDIKACKMKDETEEACKKRVQFITPNS